MKCDNSKHLPNDINLTHTDFLNTQPNNSPRPSIFILGFRKRAHSCFLFYRGCCLHLVMFIKMAVISCLNVNYCYDTQDNLTCFSNLFFLVIRCSNWKIFQGVTTVLKVKWLGGGNTLIDLNYNLELGVQSASPDKPCRR